MVRESQTDEALELGNEFSGTQHKMYYGRVFSAWTMTEARSLFEFLDDLPSSDLKSIAARELITWSRFEPVLTDEEIEHAKTLLNDDDQESVKFFQEM